MLSARWIRIILFLIIDNQLRSCYNVQGGPKIDTIFVRLNFVKY